jgi:Mg-chelatase subunit ChlD
MSDELNKDDKAALLRWRLALGARAEERPELALGGLADDATAATTGLDRDGIGELDRALSFVYGEDQAGGKSAARPYLPQWLAAVRRFFRHDVVAMVQKDAIERRNLTQLLLEPETLPLLDRNVELAATILAAKQLVPDRAKDTARAIVREIAEELRAKLEGEVRGAILGALRRDRRSPLRALRNLDWQRTVRRNLDTWDPKHRRLVPRHLHFMSRQRRHHDWDVCLLVDQSGSMAESVVYASVMAAIFASLDVLRTRLAFFDTEVVDVSDQLGDPVDVLFAAQLGGGTDIHRAVAYAQASWIERPERTLLLLVTDLFEGSDPGPLLARARALVEAKVRVVVLLALTDAGRPSYEHATAQALGALGIPCFGCTPRLLARVMERVLRGDDVASIDLAGLR